jgi:hypothetical protein
MPKKPLPKAMYNFKLMFLQLIFNSMVKEVKIGAPPHEILIHMQTHLRCILSKWMNFLFKERG